MLERLAALDVALFAAIHRALWGTRWLTVLQVVQLAGEGAGLAALAVFTFLVAPKGRRLALLGRIFVPVAVAGGASEIMKRLVDAERPRTLIAALVLNADPKLPKHFSWPSGHTTVVFAFATAVLLLERRFAGAAAGAFGIAAVTGLARIAVGAHFPGDVLGGALLGASVAWLTTLGMDAAAPYASRHWSQSRWNRLS